MISFRKVTIENYKSIEGLEYDITPGVFIVKSEVINGQFTSNGGGKSSALQAIYVGLYGSDFQGAPIDTVSNRYTKKPFVITVDFEKNGDEYKVVNDRKNKRHFLFKNGKLLSKTYASTGKMIFEIVGMSAATFRFTHYITSQTILELTQSLSNATIFNEILQVTQLKKIRENVRELRKEINYELTELNIAREAIKQHRQLMDLSSVCSIEPLEEKKEAIEAEIDRLRRELSVEVEEKKAVLQDVLQELQDVKSEVQNKEKLLSNRVCPVCSSELLKGDEEENIRAELQELMVLLGNIKDKRSEVVAEIDKISTYYSGFISPLEVQLKDINKQIETVITLNDLMDSVAFSDDLSKTEDKHKELRDKLNFFEEVDRAIRTGAVFETIMTEFFTIVNLNIQRYKRIINFSDFNITASPEKSGMRLIVEKDGAPIPVESLSNGEKARLSLLLLSSLLESMHTISGNHTNFVVFDEATSSFDKSGIKELKDLFEHLTSLGSACFIISHGNELKDVELSGELLVTKRNNLSTGRLYYYSS